MASTVVSVGVFAVLLVVGCARSAPPAGKAVTVEQVCGEPDGSRVRLTGYVRYRRGLMSFCSTNGGKKTCDLALYPTPEAPPDWSPMRPRTGPEPLHARLSVPVGSQPGEMAELPEKFSSSDVRVHLPNEATAPEGGHVTIDGKLSVIPSADPAAAKQCFVNVEWAGPA
jgi:hypothetical protein